MPNLVTCHMSHLSRRTHKARRHAAHAGRANPKSPRRAFDCFLLNRDFNEKTVEARFPPSDWAYFLKRSKFYPRAPGRSS